MSTGLTIGKLYAHFKRASNHPQLNSRRFWMGLHSATVAGTEIRWQPMPWLYIRFCPMEFRDLADVHSFDNPKYHCIWNPRSVKMLLRWLTVPVAETSIIAFSTLYGICSVMFLMSSQKLINYIDSNHSLKEMLRLIWPTIKKSDQSWWLYIISNPNWSLKY